MANKLVFTSIYNHGLDTGDHIKLIQTDSDTFNQQSFYVKVLNTRSLALYADSSLTQPIYADNTINSSSTRILVIDKTTATYSEVPRDWTGYTYAITWINSSVTLSWINSESTITWKNTL